MPKRLKIRADREGDDDVGVSSFRFAGRVKITADKKNAKALPKLKLVAYTGRPMLLDAFYHPAILDCESLRFEKSRTAVIADHDTKMRVGHTTGQLVLAAGKSNSLESMKLRGPVVAATGVVSSSMGVATGIVTDATNGFPFQVSIGAMAPREESLFVPEGQSIEVNGRTWSGPINVVRNALIHEISICVNGADSDTSAVVAATRNRPMTFKRFLASLELDSKKLNAQQLIKLKATWKRLHATADPSEGDDVDDTDDIATMDADPQPTPNPDPAASGGTNGGATNGTPANGTPAPADPIAAHRTKIADDVARVDRIQAIAVELPRDQVTIEGRKMTAVEFKDHAIRSGMSVEQYELNLRRASYSAPERAPAFHSQNRDVDNNAMSCAILRACHVPMSSTNRVTGQTFGVEHMFDEEVLEASHRPQYQIGNSIQALFDVQIRAAGMHFPGSNRKSKDLMRLACQAWHKIRAASGVSGLDIGNVLENVMNKSALAAFQGVEAVWSFIAGRRPLNDFKPHSAYRLNFDGSFKKVGPDGELKHISMTDSKESVQADTYGAVVKIDYATFRNDDLGMVEAQARGLGLLAAFRIEESVFVLLLSNAGSFFSTTNKNLITGASSALSITSIDSARVLFRNQTMNGKPVMASPNRLLAGTLLETLSGQIYRDVRLEATGTTTDRVFVDNPHVGLYPPYISPYINNTGIKDQDGNAITGQSGTKWWLLADPASPYGSALVIGFLDGHETPYFDESETDFTMPNGMQFRSYLYWGTAFGSPQLAVQSAGA